MNFSNLCCREKTLKTRRPLLLLSFLPVLLFSPLQVWGLECSAPNVPISDKTYRHLDKLVAFGLIDKTLYGQRPFSRNEIARQIEEAIQTLESGGKVPAFAGEILKRLEGEYQADLKCRAANREEKMLRLFRLTAWQEIAVGKSPPRTLFRNKNGEIINAEINPLFDTREGRHFVSGFNSALEGEGSLGLTPYFSLHFHPRIQFQSALNNVDGVQQIFIHELYGRFLFKNISLLAGRASRHLGQLKNGGGLLSNQARPLDHFALSNDVPFKFWFLGPSKLSFFYADLGHEQRFPHPYLAGWKLSFQPKPVFEFGVSLLSLGGGRGSPEVGFGDRIQDIFGLGSEGNLGGTAAPTSNRMGGLDFRFRVPPLRGTEFYIDLMTEDANEHLDQQFKNNMGYLFGLYFPRLDPAGRMDIRLEYKIFQHRLFRHHIFTDGWTLNRRLLGDNLGPQSQGLYVDFAYDIRKDLLLKPFFAWERRDADDFVLVSPANFQFRKTTDRNAEDRLRFGSWLNLERETWRVESEIAFEHVNDFNNVNGAARNNFLILGRIVFPFGGY